MKSTALGEDAYLEYENALREVRGSHGRIIYPQWRRHSRFLMQRALQDLADMQRSAAGKAASLPSIRLQYFPLQACAFTASVFTLPAGASSAAR